MIYLDNAATTWPKPETVYAAVDHCLRNQGGSPGRGGHSLARAASNVVYEAREELATLFGVKDSSEIVFAQNATDALNSALFGLLVPGDRIVTTSMEHNAVARPLKVLAERGITVSVIGCDGLGRLNMAALREALQRPAKAIVLSHGSNVTGTLQPVGEVGRLAVKAGAILVVDAAQTAGVEDIDVENMGIGMLAFSGHKGLLGPQGTGGLYVRGDIRLIPLRFGGTGSISESDRQPDFYPDRLESGTNNTPGIAGLLAGVRFIRQTGREKIRAWELNLTRRLLTGLAAIPGVKIYGPGAEEERTAVVSFNKPGQDSGELAFRLDRDYGVACRSGLHCAPWAHRTIGTLETGTIRFSPGCFTTIAEIDAALEAVRQICAKLQ